LHHNVLLGNKTDLDAILIALLKLEKKADNLSKYTIEAEKAKRVTKFNF